MNEEVLEVVVVVLWRGGVLRTLHVGRRSGRGKARGRRGRIPAVTSRPPSAPDIHLVRSPAPYPDRSTTLHCICHYCCYDLFIYARKLTNTISAGHIGQFSEPTLHTVVNQDD